MLLPTTARTGISFSASTCSTPMCASPGAPPPLKARTTPRVRGAARGLGAAISGSFAIRFSRRGKLRQVGRTGAALLGAAARAHGKTGRPASAGRRHLHGDGVAGVRDAVVLVHIHQPRLV